MKQQVAFGEWAPDASTLDSDVLTIARNVLPAVTSYQPFPRLADYSTGVLIGSRGLTMARLSDGTFGAFAGNPTKLYKFNPATLAWADVSRVAGGNYALSNEERWDFAQFGTQLIAVHIADDPQAINVDTGTNFAALGGSPPKARYVTVIGDFVVLGALTGDETTVRWSGINDATSWTVGTNLADFQTFPDGGRITGVVGGEVGYVLQEGAIRRMRFIPGSDYVFSFEAVEKRKGCVSPYGWANVAGTVFYVAEDGFYSIGPAGMQPIGAQRVNTWFRTNTDQARVALIRAVADPVAPRIYWWCYSNGNANAYDLAVIYDWSLNKWTYATVEVQDVAALGTAPTTLDALDGWANLDALPFSLDSRVWEGGRPVLAAIKPNGRVAFFSGPNAPALMRTGERHFAAGGRAYVRGITPMIDTADVTISMRVRERLQDAPRNVGPAGIGETGMASIRASGRTHQVDVAVAEGAVWSHTQGYEVDFETQGAR